MRGFSAISIMFFLILLMFNITYEGPRLDELVLVKDINKSIKIKNKQLNLEPDVSNSNENNKNNDSVNTEKKGMVMCVGNDISMIAGSIV